MIEVGLVVGLALVGVGVLVVGRQRLSTLPLAALAAPAGIGVYVLVALAQLVLMRRVLPVAGLAVTAGVGVVAFAIAAARGHLDRAAVLAVLAAALAAALVGIVSVTQHPARVTPDSIDHLLIAVDLQEPGAMTAIPEEIMLKRQVGFGLAQTLAAVTDRQYVVSLSPLLGLSAFGLFAWFCWSRSAALLPTHRRWLVALALLFLASTNRMVFHAFYVNVHMAVALMLFMALIGCWLLATQGDRVWAPIVGVALGMLTLFRPEAPLLIALVLVPMAATDLDRVTRRWLVVPLLAIFLPWYALLWRYAPDGSSLSPLAPVSGNLVIVAMACALVIVGGRSSWVPITRLADRLLLPGFAVLLAGFVVSDPSILLDTLRATVQNLGPDLTFTLSPGDGGLWAFTWVALIPLVAYAGWSHRFDGDRIWRVVISGFGILYFLMPYLRGSPWRVGSGDSGSRIASHIVLVLVAYLILTLVERRNGPLQRGPSPRRGEYLTA